MEGASLHSDPSHSGRFESRPDLTVDPVEAGAAEVAGLAVGVADGASDVLAAFAVAVASARTWSSSSWSEVLPPPEVRAATMMATITTVTTMPVRRIQGNPPFFSLLSLFVLVTKVTPYLYT